MNLVLHDELEARSALQDARVEQQRADGQAHQLAADCLRLSILSVLWSGLADAIHIRGAIQSNSPKEMGQRHFP